MSFQKTVLIIASTLLIIMLVGIGILLARKRIYNNDWKPSISDCPDDFTKTNPKFPDNCFPLNNSAFDSKKCDLKEGKNFNNMKECEKYIWANKCHVKWDGLTNDDALRKKCK